jgi:hypothetical protein
MCRSLNSLQRVLRSGITKEISGISPRDVFSNLLALFGMVLFSCLCRSSLELRSDWSICHPSTFELLWKILPESMSYRRIPRQCMIGTYPWISLVLPVSQGGYGLHTGSGIWRRPKGAPLGRTLDKRSKQQFFEDKKTQKSFPKLCFLCRSIQFRALARKFWDLTMQLSKNAFKKRSFLESLKIALLHAGL